MYKQIKIESKVMNLRIVEKTIDEVTNELGISQDSYGKIMVSTMEGVNNAILHGNHSEPEKIVDIEIEFKGSILKIKITDEGRGFRPEEVQDPTIPENIDLMRGR